jgi:FAD:protein FMN transferase
MQSPSPLAERAQPGGSAGLVSEVRRARPLLGTLVQVRAAGPHTDAQLHAAVGAAFAAVERVQQLMSYQDPRSELSRVNRDAVGCEQRIDAEFYAVLEAALRFAALSHGAFDPCIGDHLEEWGYLPRSAPASGDAGARGGTWRDVRLLGDCRVRLERAVRLDLGGIAKGYAVDRAVNALQLAGIERILVNAGGDLRIAGPWAQQVWLRHPQAPHLSAGTLRLSNAALATSAAYYSRRRSPRGEVSALLDPSTARPYTQAGSVSVRAADCMSADALTKIVLFAPPQVAEQALAACAAQGYVQPAAAATG